MKKALTIGELLVTMAIIGIIATLVLPGFIQDYHKKVYTAKVKKMVEMMDAAIAQACADSNASYFYQTQYAEPENYAKQKEFIEKYLKVVSKNSVTQSYKAIRGGATANHMYTDRLAGGEYVDFKCWNNSSSDKTCDLWFDINGSDGPNVGGRDVFVLTLMVKDNKFHGAYPEKCGGALRGASETEEAYVARMQSSTTYDAAGIGCFAHLIYDNWEMKY